VRAEPEVNAQVRDSPSVLTLYFSEPLERKFSRARVLDQDGNSVDDGIEFDDADAALMRVRLKAVSPGYLTVLWENVSSVDGHRISGSYPITVLNPDGSQPAGNPVAAGAQTSGDEIKPQRVAVKALLLLGGATLSGALAFLAFVTPALPGSEGIRARQALERRALTLIAIAIGLLALAGVTELVLQASDIGGKVADALDTRWGERWLLRQIVLLLPLVLLTLMLASEPGSTARRALAGLALAGAAAYLALIASVSHAAAGGGSFWAIASDFIHLLAASVWTGMLALLVLLFFWSRRGLARGEKHAVLSTALARFSNLALLSVALLLLTGVVNATIELGRIADLTETAYGRALLVKLILLLPLLAVGGVNAYLLRPRLTEASGGQRQEQEQVEAAEAQLAGTVRWELGLVVAVMIVAALLAQVSPTRGRLQAPQQAGPFTDTVFQSGITATLVIDPNEAGNNTFEVYLTGAVDTVENVSLRFQQKGGEEARLTMDPTNPPTFYVGHGPYLAQAGDWTVSVNLRRSTGSDLLLPFEVRVARSGVVPASAPRSGGAYASPLPAGLAAPALVATAGLLAVALVYLSLRPAGLTGGYLSLLFDQVSARVELPALRPVWSLAALVVIGIGLGLILGSHLHQRLSPEQAASKENPIASTPESVARGRMLFAQNCTQCHGETGRGDGPLANSLPLQPANLYDHVPYHPDQFFFNVISNGLSGVMPGFRAQLSEEDRWNVLNFLRDQFGNPPAVQ
jgi:copper transport protein